ncbi:MAG: hypothetical protein AABY27_00910 [Pseudomonadota bacterium]
MPEYFHSLKQILDSDIKYIISIGKRQPMHIGHKKSLERILSIRGIQLIYVIGSTNTGGDALFDPYTNPLTVDQQIEQFKTVFPNEEVIFLAILDVADMSKWGPSIVKALDDINIQPNECVIHFIGKPEDRLKEACSFSLPSGEIITLKKGQWLIEALGSYGFIIWFDDEMKVDLSISARKIRKLDLKHLSKQEREILAASDYLLKIATKARLNNPDKDALKDKPISLEDLSLERIRLEYGRRI